MRASESFRFQTRLSLQELTGLKARNLDELLKHLKTVPDGVIYHHTHHFLEEHQYLSPEPPNDFAYWVTAALKEVELGEMLMGINTCEFSSIAELRAKLVSVIEDYMRKNQGPLQQATKGQALYFIKSVSFIFPTPFTAETLEGFLEALKKVSIHSIFFHVFEARLRLGKQTNDFSFWLEHSLGEKEIARKISKLDPYVYTLEGLRSKIVHFIEARLAERGQGAGHDHHA